LANQNLKPQSFAKMFEWYWLLVAGSW